MKIRRLRKIGYTAVALSLMFGGLSFRALANDGLIKGSPKCEIEKVSVPVPIGNMAVPLASSSQWLYTSKITWYPVVTSEVGVTATSTATYAGKPKAITSIYARASIVQYNGTATTKKSTKKSASSHSEFVSEKVPLSQVKCFKSGHQYKNKGYEPVTDRMVKYPNGK